MNDFHLLLLSQNVGHSALQFYHLPLQHMLESKQENVSGVRPDDLTAVNPKTRVLWDGNVMLCRWVNSYRRV
jgi:hypothetical protein